MVPKAWFMKVPVLGSSRSETLDSGIPLVFDLDSVVCNNMVPKSSSARGDDDRFGGWVIYLSGSPASGGSDQATASIRGDVGDHLSWFYIDRDRSLRARFHRVLAGIRSAQDVAFDQCHSCVSTVFRDDIFRRGIT